MTLEELKQRCIKNYFNYAYGGFKRSTQPPHLVAKSQESNNILADNKVYKKKIPIKLDYTYINKNIQEQNRIEDIILSDIPWRKSEEIYLPDEEVWQVSYFFEILN